MRPMTETSAGAAEESQQDDEYQRVIASLRVAYGPGPAALRDGWAKEEFKAEERRRFLDLLRERGAASLLEVGPAPGTTRCTSKSRACGYCAPTCRRTWSNAARQRASTRGWPTFQPWRFPGVLRRGLRPELPAPRPDPGPAPRPQRDQRDPRAGRSALRRDLGGKNEEGPVNDPRYPVPRFFAFRSDQVMRQLLTGQFDILSFAAFERAGNSHFQSFMLQKTMT